MLAATKVKMSNSKKMQTNKQTKAHATLISPIKHVTRKFRVVVMKKKMVKKCTKKCAARPKWFFLLIRPIFFFFYAVVIAVAIWHYTILFFCLGKLQVY